MIWRRSLFADGVEVDGDYSREESLVFLFIFLFLRIPICYVMELGLEILFFTLLH